MTFRIARNEKFAAVAIVEAERVALNGPIELDGGLWISPVPPMKVDKVWRDWIGSIHSNEIERANLWLVGKRRSVTPNVYNDEDNDLKDEVWRLFLGLLLVGPPSYQRKYLLNGTNEGTAPRLRAFDAPTNYLPSRERRAFVVSKAHAMRAQRARAGLRVIFVNREYLRLRRGIRVFIDGLSHRLSEARLHQFVRAAESVVKPAFGHSANMFAERCSVFVGDSPESRTILRECYLMRSAEEHLRDVLDVLNGYGSEKRGPIFYRRVIQSEDLARQVLTRIVSNPSLRSNFRDSSLDNFWALPLATQRRIWGASIKIKWPL